MFGFGGQTLSISLLSSLSSCHTAQSGSGTGFAVELALPLLATPTATAPGEEVCPWALGTAAQARSKEPMKEPLDSVSARSSESNQLCDSAFVFALLPFVLAPSCT